VIHLRSFQSIIIGLLSVFLLLPGQALGTVLCIGVDGHIAVEAAQNGRCGFLGSLVPSDEHLTKIPASTDHCGSCVDVPLLTSDTDSRQLLPVMPLLLQFETAGLALVPWVVSASPDCTAPPSWLSSSRSIHTPLRALRTVILLV
jgi:hypothetical protein